MNGAEDEGQAVRELGIKIRARYDAEAPHRKQLRGQVEDAHERLTLEPEGRIRLPWDAPHSIASWMVPGMLIVFTAQTAGGKTTLLQNLLDHFVAAATAKVANLGLEQAPDEQLTKLAALRAGVDPAIAVENSWSDHPNGDALYETVRAELLALQQPTFADRCLMLPQRYIGPGELDEAAIMAANFGAHVMIVDHIHHIDHGNERDSFRGFSQLVQQCKRIAEELHLVMLVAAQLNRQGAMGDVLQRYQPPRLNHIQGGGTIEQVANKVFGIYRPIRFDATSDDLKAVKAGRVEVRSVLEQNVMGVVCMKNRERGDLEGARAFLSVAHGRVSDLDSGHQLAIDAKRHGIRTGSSAA